jgi:hypothetical protein
MSGQRVIEFIEQWRHPGLLHANFLGVMLVIQADANDFAGPGEQVFLQSLTKHTQWAFLRHPTLLRSMIDFAAARIVVSSRLSAGPTKPSQPSSEDSLAIPHEA